MPEQALTVAELIARLDVPVVVSTAAGLEKRVGGVKIVTSRDATKTMPPHTVLVLAGDVASSGWSVDLVIRTAWERAAACIILPHSDVHASSTAALAQSLDIVLLAVTADPLDIAVEAAKIIASPDTMAATIVAAIDELAVPSASPATTVKALARALPGYHYSVMDSWGAVVASTHPQGKVPKENGETVASLKVPFPRADSPATICAVPRHDLGVIRRNEVGPVLRIAAAPLTAWAALRRLQEREKERYSVGLLDRFLEGPENDEGVLSEMAALGWSSTGPHYIVVVAAAKGRRQRLRQVTLLRERWPAMTGSSPFVGRGAAFICWLPADQGGKKLAPAKVLQAAARAVEELSSELVPAVGIVGPVPGLRSLGTAVEKGLLAARIAAETGKAALDSSSISERGVLSALVAPEALSVAQATLENLVRADPQGELIRTLLVSLDNGERVSQIAQELKLHRNTVAARLERIRSLGVDISDPARRLAIHLSASLVVGSLGVGNRSSPEATGQDDDRGLGS